MTSAGIKIMVANALMLKTTTW